MNSAFSEYVLYEPMLRILTAQGYSVECEFALENDAPGDHPRIDFVASHETHGKIAIEVKWKKDQNINVDNDCGKLITYSDRNADSHVFLCVFGTQGNIAGWDCNQPRFEEFGDPAYADMVQTKYGCRMFWLT